jgi:hypothetical protein
MKEIAIGACVIRIWPETQYLETVFSEGHKVPAAPNPDDPASVALAARLGYRGANACWQLSRDHECLHSWCAVQEGLDFSPTLWHVAYHVKSPPGLMRDEEARVLALQALLHDCPADPAHVAQLVGRTGQSQGALVDAARVWLASIWQA